MSVSLVADATRALVYAGASSSAVAATFAPETLRRAWVVSTEPLRVAYGRLPLADSLSFDMVAGTLLVLVLVALVGWLVSNAVAVILRASLLALALVLAFAGLEALLPGGVG